MFYALGIDFEDKLIQQFFTFFKQL